MLFNENVSHRTALSIHQRLFHTRSHSICPVLAGICFSMQGYQATTLATVSPCLSPPDSLALVPTDAYRRVRRRTVTRVTTSCAAFNILRITFPISDVSPRLSSTPTIVSPEIFLRTSTVRRCLVFEITQRSDSTLSARTSSNKSTSVVGGLINLRLILFALE